MKNTTKKVSSSTIELLKATGHAVPRNEENEIITFVVGKNYEVINPSGNEKITVRCTQDSPYHLRVLTPQELNK